mmetsp:Transcript_105711/g.264681  ORF Transcript_105711/g.264681 Transcript_105711/m.264681 type:complete len:208 (+) Transcript_105711:437-1060(+)
MGVAEPTLSPAALSLSPTVLRRRISLGMDATLRTNGVSPLGVLQRDDAAQRSWGLLSRSQRLSCSKSPLHLLRSFSSTRSLMCRRSAPCPSRVAAAEAPPGLEGLRSNSRTSRQVPRPAWLWFPLLGVRTIHAEWPSLASSICGGVAHASGLLGRPSAAKKSKASRPRNCGIDAATAIPGQRKRAADGWGGLHVCRGNGRQSWAASA